MTTVLGLNNKFLIYQRDNRIVIYWKEISIFACYEKKKKGAFHEFNWVKAFFNCIVYSMSKSLNFLSLSFKVLRLSLKFFRPTKTHF